MDDLGKKVLDPLHLIWKDPEKAKEMQDALNRMRSTDGQPERQGYGSVLDDQGRLRSQYEIQRLGDVGFNPVTAWKAVNVDQRGMDAVRQRALSQGPSQWANLALAQQAAENRDMRQRAEQQGASQAAQAQSQLAMRGGLSGGAAERLASQSSRDIAMRRFEANRQAMQNRLGIRTEDERQRTGLLQQLPGMDLAQGQFQSGQQQAAKDVEKFNTQGQMQTDFQNRQLEYQRQAANQAASQRDVMGRNAYNSQAYSDAMRAWAGGKQAEATIAAGGGGKKGGGGGGGKK